MPGSSRVPRAALVGDPFFPAIIAKPFFRWLPDDANEVERHGRDPRGEALAPEQDQPPAAAPASPVDDPAAQVLIARHQRVGSTLGWDSGRFRGHGRFFSARAKARSMLRGWTA